MSISEIPNKISSFFKTSQGKTLLKWLQRIINVGILVWLIYQLSVIGWQKVWHSLPSEPLFYLLFLAIFLQLPLFEVFIYRIIWPFNVVKAFPTFLLKRVYNKDVMGYSGELYFFAWARKTLPKSGKEIFKIIKDNNIISSVASTFISVGLLSVFLFTDQIKIIEWIANQNQMYFWGGLLLVIVAIVLVIRFRHYVISMPLRMAYKIFGIQLFRLLLGQFFSLLMYYVVLPSTPIYVWFTLIAIDIILSRIPFIPNRDLIFAGISIGLAGRLAVPQDAIAGITLTRGALNKLGGAVSFGLAHILKDEELAPSPEQNISQYNEWSHEEQNPS